MTTKRKQSYPVTAIQVTHEWKYSEGFIQIPVPTPVFPSIAAEAGPKDK